MIRNIIESDLDICEKLVSQPELINFQGHHVTKDWLSILNEDGLSYLLENDNKIIGCLFSEKLKMNGCLLWLIAIDSEYKTRGYGTMLLKYFESQCKEKGIEWIVLYSTTNSLYNHYFYTKNGYENKSGSFFEFGKEI